MPHLVDSIDRPRENPVPVADVRAQLKDAHAYLVELGGAAMRHIDANTPDYAWGTHMKRIRIVFPAGDRPALISTTHETHSLIEVINQLATMERLIDALHWAEDNLLAYELLRCHPTTGSQKTGESDLPDNDIVLMHPDGQLARCEVSDVSGEKDTNGKEFKDLMSLGVRLTNMDAWPEGSPPFADRLFMIVSTEMGERIRRRMTTYYPQKQPYFSYMVAFATPGTTMFEVIARR